MFLTHRVILFFGLKIGYFKHQRIIYISLEIFCAKKWCPCPTLMQRPPRNKRCIGDVHHVALGIAS